MHGVIITLMNMRNLSQHAHSQISDGQVVCQEQPIGMLLQVGLAEFNEVVITQTEGSERGAEFLRPIISHRDCVRGDPSQPQGQNPESTLDVYYLPL